MKTVRQCPSFVFWSNVGAIQVENLEWIDEFYWLCCAVCLDSRGSVTHPLHNDQKDASFVPVQAGTRASFRRVPNTTTHAGELTHTLGLKSLSLSHTDGQSRLADRQSVILSGRVAIEKK